MNIKEYSVVGIMRAEGVLKFTGTNRTVDMYTYQLEHSGKKDVVLTALPSPMIKDAAKEYLQKNSDFLSRIPETVTKEELSNVLKVAKVEKVGKVAKVEKVEKVEETAHNVPANALGTLDTAAIASIVTNVVLEMNKNLEAERMAKRKAEAEEAKVKAETRLEKALAASANKAVAKASESGNKVATAKVALGPEPDRKVTPKVNKKATTKATPKATKAA